jgi:phosphoenolpyruvate-protein phosphotransferase
MDSEGEQSLSLAIHAANFLSRAEQMQVLIGQSISPGYAEGNAVLFDRVADFEVPRYAIDQSQVSYELLRIREALERSCRDLRRLEKRVLAELGDAQSSIFTAHLGLLQDKQFLDRINKRIQEQLVNAEQAIECEVAELARLLGALDSEYLRERAHDIRDIGSRLMRQLDRQARNSLVDLPQNSVLIARELLPSETIDLDRKQVAAIVTEEGGENSHAAILARALGIPAVTAISNATQRIPPGTRLLVDGQSGRVTVAPNANARLVFVESRHRYDEDSVEAYQTEGRDCVTEDGIPITLMANLSRLDETDLVRQHHLRGVGLFRTEFLYMDACEPPSFNKQRYAYHRLFDALGEYPIVIRTLDLGADKVPTFLESQKESNPNLGLRGLRFSLAHPELFKTQLRALLAAMGDHDVRLMFPMVLGASDLREGINIVEEIACELGVARMPKIGAMIETPSSLFSLDEILKLVDFVSIGTNDLTQFMLAADRNAAELAEDYSVLHPSVLRAMQSVVEAGRSANRTVCVCGEAAGDPVTAGLFVGLGVTHLSMSPLRAARVGVFLRSRSSRELKSIAAQAVHSESIRETKRYLKTLQDSASLKRNCDGVGS